MIKREVVVIGAGPAGLSAAIEAAKKGARVLLIDESLQAGGQLFKQIHKFFGSSAHQSGVRGIDIGQNLLEEAKDSGVEIWLNTAAVGLFAEKKIAVEKGCDGKDRTMEVIKAEKIVIATGASENAISFKGWTLPGIMGAGAAQTMINIHRVLPGQNILMVGSGNVGLIVSYQLLQAGANVVGVIEAAPEIGGYGVHSAKITRLGVPIHTSTTVIEARGDDKTGVKEAVICGVDEDWEPVEESAETISVDTIAIAAGLKPLMELARMYGCECSFVPELGGWMPVHDKNMETTCEGIYVAGDAGGVEEANTALEEGRLAGIAIAESLDYISENEAGRLKENIRERLDGLRMGPFGMSRKEAKDNIMQKVAMN